MKKKSLFSQISTKPSNSSIKWAGEKVSILSAIFLWGMWLCRVFSLLQISKLVFRKVVKALRRSSIDKNSTRINVPPLFCEIYFILWFALFLVAYKLHWDNIFIKIAIYYYLFESVVWVLYYTVFRRFFEENYSIYHELEYLTVLMLLIPTQALAFATLYGTQFSMILSGLLGAGADSTPVSVKILGALFGAIVISMIISAFPTEKVKKHKKKPKTLVIGCGDVVQKRLYPALCNKYGEDGEIFVYDLQEAKDKVNYCKYLASDQLISEAILSSADANSTVWIETPTYKHISYLKKALESKASLVVLEKPICCDKEELLYVEDLIEDENRERVFFLSYYLLEKALPILYLACHNDHYKKYLELEVDDLLLNWRFLIGALVETEISITEGEDVRDWVYNKEYGGQLLETMIHNVLIASLFCGLPQFWTNVVYKESKSKDGVDSLRLNAESGRSKIKLSINKNANKKDVKRFAKFTFTGGYLYADFDSQTATVYLDGVDKKINVNVKSRYTSKYSVMVDLVERSKIGEISSVESDGLKNQIAIIKWLLDLNETNK